MNDWQDEWRKQIEKASHDFEYFLDEVGEVAESVVDEASENLGYFFEQFESDVFGEVDSFVRNLVDVIITTTDEIDAAISDEWEHFSDDDFTMVSYHKPSAQSHPACINCANYHGQVYNGNLLVCGMHPSGFEGDSCPDWKNDRFTNN